jgi:hypothetical protein
MKSGKTLQELAIELERQNEVKRDYIANTSQMRMLVPEHDEHEETPVLNLPKIPNFTINSVAHDQIAAKTGIPVSYYNRMLDKDPELLATNVNTWFQKNPENRMIRTLDGKARAFLSDRYRRIDNHEIASAVLPIIAGMEGAVVESCELTDKRMYLKVVNERIQTEVSKGDIVQSGILISNSETGLGAVSVMPLVYRLVCKNGLIANTAGKRSRHVGRSNEGEDDFEIYSNETIIADDKAFVMKLRDIVRATADVVQFERIVSTMKISKDAKITSDDVPAVVQLAAKSYGLYEKESQSVLDHLIRGGELSLYGLANAVTRHAQDVDSYDRSTELEITAWKMMNMGRNDWTKLNAA